MKKLFRLFISIFVSGLIYWVCDRSKIFKYIIENNQFMWEIVGSAISVFIFAVLTVIFYFTISKWISKQLIMRFKILEDNLSKMQIRELIMSVSGCLTGLLAATLISFTVYRFPFGNILALILYGLFGMLGFRVAQRKKEDILLKTDNDSIISRPKILDTSVIIDGRILDILQTGFVEGKIIIPHFVLEELRHIADSSDSLKRSRGRLGLDVLNQIQTETDMTVEIMEWHSKNAMEVDSKLLKMAEELNGFVVTNDYNLNKVAEFQKVSVLNINELSNAIKSIIIAGQQMKVFILKQGKEHNQGVAYLNDGTMIVVEDGAAFIGIEISVMVTSILQTSAGRMIFSKAPEKSEIISNSDDKVENESATANGNSMI